MNTRKLWINNKRGRELHHEENCDISDDFQDAATVFRLPKRMRDSKPQSTRARKSRRGRSRKTAEVATTSSAHGETSKPTINTRSHDRRVEDSTTPAPDDIAPNKTDLENIENVLCLKSEKLCPSCKVIVPSNVFGDHFKECLQKFRHSKRRCDVRVPGTSRSEEGQVVNEQEEPPAVLPCPVCKKPFKSKTQRLSHVKTCAQARGLTPEQLLLASRLLEKQTEEWSDLGLPTTFHQPNTRSKANHSGGKGKKDLNDPDIAMAVALSRSMVEEEVESRTAREERLLALGMEDIVNEEREVKPLVLPPPPPPPHSGNGNTSSKQVRRGRKAQKGLSLTLKTPLVTRSIEERERLLSDKVAELITSDDTIRLGWPNVVTRNYPKRIAALIDKSCTLWESGRRGSDAPLASFYVPELQPYITPKETVIGSLFKQLSQIPGRLNTTVMHGLDEDSESECETEKTADAKEFCTQMALMELMNSQYYEEQQSTLEQTEHIDELIQQSQGFIIPNESITTQQNTSLQTENTHDLIQRSQGIIIPSQNVTAQQNTSLQTEHTHDLIQQSQDIIIPSQNVTAQQNKTLQTEHTHDLLQHSQVFIIPNQNIATQQLEYDNTTSTSISKSDSPSYVLHEPSRSNSNDNNRIESCDTHIQDDTNDSGTHVQMVSHGDGSEYDNECEAMNNTTHERLTHDRTNTRASSLYQTSADIKDKNKHDTPCSQNVPESRPSCKPNKRSHENAIPDNHSSDSDICIEVIEGSPKASPESGRNITQTPPQPTGEASNTRTGIDRPKNNRDGRTSAEATAQTDEMRSSSSSSSSRSSGTSEEGTTISGSLSIRDSNNTMMKTLMRDWEYILESGYMTDVTITTSDGASVAAHSLVLLTRCPEIYKTMNSVGVVKWHNWTSTTARNFLSYLYTGTCRSIMPGDSQWFELYDVAVYYNCSDLVSYMESQQKDRSISRVTLNDAGGGTSSGRLDPGIPVANNASNLFSCMESQQKDGSISRVPLNDAGDGASIDRLDPGIPVANNASDLVSNLGSQYKDNRVMLKDAQDEVSGGRLDPGAALTRYNTSDLVSCTESQKDSRVTDGDGASGGRLDQGTVVLSENTHKPSIPVVNLEEEEYNMSNRPLNPTCDSTQIIINTDCATVQNLIGLYDQNEDVRAQHEHSSNNALLSPKERGGSKRVQREEMPGSPDMFEDSLSITRTRNTHPSPVNTSVVQSVPSDPTSCASEPDLVIEENRGDDTVQSLSLENNRVASHKLPDSDGVDGSSNDDITFIPTASGNRCDQDDNDEMSSSTRSPLPVRRDSTFSNDIIYSPIPSPNGEDVIVHSNTVPRHNVLGSADRYEGMGNNNTTYSPVPDRNDLVGNTALPLGCCSEDSNNVVIYISHGDTEANVSGRLDNDDGQNVYKGSTDNEDQLVLAEESSDTHKQYISNIWEDFDGADSYLRIPGDYVMSFNEGVPPSPSKPINRNGEGSTCPYPSAQSQNTAVSSSLCEPVSRNETGTACLSPNAQSSNAPVTSSLYEPVSRNDIGSACPYPNAHSSNAPVTSSLYNPVTRNDEASTHPYPNTHSSTPLSYHHKDRSDRLNLTKPGMTPRLVIQSSTSPEAAGVESLEGQPTDDTLVNMAAEIEQWNDDDLDQSGNQNPSFSTPLAPRRTGGGAAKKSTVTPQPDYNNMKSPQLKKELQKYGVCSLSRKKAVMVLQHIYEQTHPFVTDSEAESSFADTPQRNVAAIQPPKCKEGGGGGAMGDQSKLPQNDDDAVKMRRRQMTEREQKLNKVTTSRGGVKRNVVTLNGMEDDGGDGNDSEEESSTQSCSTSSTESSDELFREAEFARGEGDTIPSTQQQQQQEPNLTSQVRQMILNDYEIHKKVLLYEPVFVEDLHAVLKANKVRCSVQTLLDVLDDLCVIVRTQANKQRRHRKAERKTKKPSKSKKTPDT